jgi:hypothetical protein
LTQSTGQVSGDSPEEQQPSPQVSGQSLGQPQKFSVAEQNVSPHTLGQSAEQLP